MLAVGAGGGCLGIFSLVYLFCASEGTTGGISQSNRPSLRPSVRPSVTNRVSAISHKLLEQI